jgi:hypothetical protein
VIAGLALFLKLVSSEQRTQTFIGSANNAAVLRTSKRLILSEQYGGTCTTDVPTKFQYSLIRRALLLFAMVGAFAFTVDPQAGLFARFQN